MPASYGWGVESTLSEDSGEILFGVATDGEKTEFMFPTDTEGDLIQDMRIAFGARLEALEKGGQNLDTDEIVSFMGYNFPVNMFLGNPTNTYEEAVAALEIIIRSDSFAKEGAENYEIQRFAAIPPSEAYPESEESE